MQALLLAATAAGLAVAGSAQAQQATGLRGPLVADDAERSLPREEDVAQANTSPIYEPVSPGALPSQPADNLADPFADRQSDRAAAGEGNPADGIAARSEAERETDLTPTGAVREPAIDSLEGQFLDPSAERVQAIEDLNRPVEDNPYEAVGVRFGTFILKPSIESGVTATSNADSSAGGSEAVLSESTLRLNAVSDWSSHSATVDAYGTFRKTLSGEEVHDVEAGIDAALELELARGYRARGTFTYSAAPESAASPVVIVGAAEEPIRQTVGGTLGLEKDAGKVRFGVTGGVIHDSYGDADLEGGGVLSQRDRDATLYTLALRTGYEISPALTPFVETEIGRNLYDQKIDSAGFQRSSDRYAVRSGLEFDLGEKFSGEVAAGWIREEFDDERLQPLSTPTVEGELKWSPQRGTDV
ncbi:MAG TPA: outer membrane beta-barrel protein, partial [Rhizobiaceae bacterium]